MSLALIADLATWVILKDEVHRFEVVPYSSSTHRAGIGLYYMAAGLGNGCLGNPKLALSLLYFCLTNTGGWPSSSTSSGPISALSNIHLNAVLKQNKTWPCPYFAYYILWKIHICGVQCHSQYDPRTGDYSSSTSLHFNPLFIWGSS